MKQKKIGDKLYVFSETPYVITEDTDADVIIIQLECVDGFAELNSDLADKMVPYNYHMFTVKSQEWSDYYDDYTITVASVTGGTLTATPLSADLGEEVTLTNTPDTGYEFTSYNVTCGGVPVTVTDNKFTMPLGDVTVSGTFIQAGTVIDPKWYGTDPSTPLDHYDVYSQGYYGLNLTDYNFRQPDGLNVSWDGSQYINCIIATFESSDDNIIRINYNYSEACVGFSTQSVGSATLTATWPTQTVDGVLYAGGTAEILINVVS